jgi:serine/threonine protein kinase
VTARTLGRYAVHGEIAAGGMATVHFGRLVGPASFSRPVAIKQLHPQYARDPDFVAMFLDEARIAARIQHPNVVQTLDVVEDDGLYLVMEYISGESLARLLRRVRERKQTVPVRIAAAIGASVLHGLHAAHEAKDVRGDLLHVVHRDVSPQNVLVGADGVARVLDFGVAKAVGRAHTTGTGHLKGKIPYMAPEQLRGNVSPRTDVFAASIVLWETLTTRRLFTGDNEGEILENVNKLEIQRPSEIVEGIPAALEEVVMRGLSRDPELRWQSARDMALAIEAAVPIATASDISAWVLDIAGDVIRSRTDRIAEIESQPNITVAPVVEARPPEIVTATLNAPARHRSVALPIAIALLVLVGSVAAFAMFRRPAAPEPVVAAPSVAATPLPSPTPTPTPTPTPSASAPPAVSSTVKIIRPPKPKVTAPNCDPPYVRAPDGKLVPKPGCL